MHNKLHFSGQVNSTRTTFQNKMITSNDLNHAWSWMEVSVRNICFNEIVSGWYFPMKKRGYDIGTLEIFVLRDNF